MKKKMKPVKKKNAMILPKISLKLFQFFFLVSNPFFFILVVLNDYKIILLFTFPRNASVTTKDVVLIPDNTNGWTLLVASVMKGFSVPTMNCCLVTLFPSY